MFYVFAYVIRIILISGVYLLTGRWLSLYGFAVKSRRVRLLRTVISVLLAVLCNFFRTAGLALVYLAALFLITDLAAFIFRRFFRAREGKRLYKTLRFIYRSALIPVCVACLAMLIGHYNMLHIVKTEYTVTSDKLHGEYTVVFISDSHYGTIQPTGVVKEKVREINDLKPDLVILGGDIVEEGTTKEEMEECFRLFGSIDSRFGVFYVYGNHDRQRYSGSPMYTEDELKETIDKSGIKILKDSTVTLGDELLLAGREDSGGPQGRAPMSELLKDADRDRFIIAADHKPLGYEENAEQGVDLQLSGHTHAGQIFPVGYINTLSGTLNYGEYVFDGCNVIVSSGMTGWGFPVRTQGRCEYVTVSIKPE